jgi:hypothetical protein
VLEDEVAFQPFEVPNRVLRWSALALPGGSTLTPNVEWRTGFPYTVFAEDYTVVGERNKVEFGQFFSADVAVTKRLSLFGRRVDLGVQTYNLTSHENSRDVVSNVAFQNFSKFRNGAWNIIALKLGVGL